MQGLNTTPVHAHTALFGVYGLLALGLVLTLTTKLGLLALVIAVGALEFAGEVAATRRRACLRALRCAPDLEFAWWHRLQSLARTVTQGQDAPRALAAAQATFERTRAVLRGRSMTSRQLALWSVLYVVLAVALVVQPAQLRDRAGRVGGATGRGQYPRPQDAPGRV